MKRLEKAFRALEARVAERGIGAPPVSGSDASATVEGSSEGPLVDGGDDPLPSTKAELLALMDQRMDQRLSGVGTTPPLPVPPKRKLTVDEASDELGLSATQREHFRLVLRETEEEFIEALMGTRDPARIQAQARALRDDPEEKERFIQNVVGNAIRNVGKLVTLEDRRDRRLREVLDKEQVEKVRKMEFRPQIIDEETEKLLEDAF
jgi:hypothetical protein